MGQLPLNVTPSGAYPMAAGLARSRLSLHDRYALLVCIVLAGYALMGKGFAYIGYPPLLIGEVTLALGLVVIYRSGAGVAMLATLPSLLLLTMLCLVTAKVTLALGPYGVDAIRDGVVILYGLYAFAVIALLLEKPDRLEWILQRYSGFAWVYGLSGAAVVYITSEAQRLMPIWPLSGVSIVYVRLGEAAVHLSGAAIFVLLGMRKVSPLWIFVMIGSIALISPSRGAMLSCVLPIGLAAVLGGQVKRFGPVLFVGGILFFAAYVASIDIPLPGGRSIGPEQMINNLESIMGSSEAANLDGTKEWRLRWWNAIVDYTFRGPYFWTGKGFGMGLAEADGFVVGLETGGPIVRSPHNVHLTMLARMGVPGFFLWISTLLAWFAMLSHGLLRARLRADTEWAKIFVWIICYSMAMLIDASFDVALEGPMLGIWFWSLFGFGIGASMIYRHERVASGHHAIALAAARAS
jgi:hypothetical protein